MLYFTRGGMSELGFGNYVFRYPAAVDKASKSLIRFIGVLLQL